MINPDFFNVEKYLVSRNIEIRYQGENVSRSGDWIGICCPSCGENKFHLGIHLGWKICSCWACPFGGNMVKLIMKLERVSYKEAGQIIEEFSEGRIYNRPKATSKQIELVNMDFERGLQDIHQQYLIDRNFDPEYISAKYRLYNGGISGRYRYRIIAPVIWQNKIVTFIARDVTGLSIPYLALEENKSIYTTKECLYGLDSVSDTVIITEGVTDVWRIGDGSVAILGKNYTPMQLILLKDVRRKFVMLDKDASEKAERLAHDLSSFGGNVETLTLSNGDPADLSEDDVKNLRNDIFGRIF